ncbi:hypothetical protein SOVF_021390 [Spinacia oleracea]|nr:hypothetical protein SOVF_021390 [Spinacia oleracea]
MKIWAYEHFPTLAPARPGVAAYPYAASWVGEVRSDVSLETFRRALRVLLVGQAPRVRLRRWIRVIDSLKRHCANLTKKLTGRDREERRQGRRDSVDRESPVDTLREQAGQSLDQGPGPSTLQRHSDVERGVVPFTYAEPTRHSVRGRATRYLLRLPPGTYFGASSSQTLSAESWAYWHKMGRMRQAYDFEMQRQFMAILQPYQYPSYQQGTHRPPGTLRISEQEPVTPGTEIDRDLERYMSQNRNKEPVIEIAANDDSD